MPAPRVHRESAANFVFSLCALCLRLGFTGKATNFLFFAERSVIAPKLHRESKGTFFFRCSPRACAFTRKAPKILFSLRAPCPRLKFTGDHENVPSQCATECKKFYHYAQDNTKYYELENTKLSVCRVAHLMENSVRNFLSLRAREHKI